MKVINKLIKGFSQVYIAILSAIPTEIGIFFRYWGYKPLFKSTKGKFRIDSGVTISGFGSIELGENIRIQKNSYLYASNGEIKLGKSFFLGTNSQITATRANITIGDNCMVASNCVLISDSHNFSSLNIPIIEQGHNSGQIIIEDDVWIASNCVVTANTKIARSSIVGAGSVITKDVKSYNIVGGVPATLIKKRI